MDSKAVSRRRSSAVRACAAIALVFALAPFARATDDPATVRRAAETLWIHGITEDIALREIGTDGVPALLELLADPTFAARDNVVAFLTYLGGPETTPALLGALRHPPGDVRVPSEDRAMLLAPRALGDIASRGDGAALEALLAMTAPGSFGGPLADAAIAGAYDTRLRDDLIVQAIEGLARSGAADARSRLENLAAVDGPWVTTGRDVRAAAQRALASSDVSSSTTGEMATDGHATGEPAVHLDGTPTAEPIVGASIEDPSSTSHEVPFTYATHVDHTNPMNDVRLDQILGLGNVLAATGDFAEDVTCCLRFVRSGTEATFGSSGDGLDVVTEQTLDQVLRADRGRRFKVVRLINWCGSAGTNIIGCAYTPGNGVAVVRHNVLAVEAALWVHEYGHNTGLSHNPDSRFIMAATANGQNDGISAAECATYHDPASAAGMVMTDLGVCHDDDLDDIGTPLDNCPDVSNPNQADSDGDGVGDVCEVTGTCDDGDADGYGDPGSAACPRGSALDCDDGDGAISPAADEIRCDGIDQDCDGLGDDDPDADGDGVTVCDGDCDDARAAVHPGAAEVCDGLDNDCNGSTDELTCDALDATGDGMVDAEELILLGRAFGAPCVPDPSSLWWAAVDFDGNGCVDGDDLAILASGWGCASGENVCD